VQRSHRRQSVPVFSKSGISGGFQLAGIPQHAATVAGQTGPVPRGPPHNAQPSVRPENGRSPVESAAAEVVGGGGAHALDARGPRDSVLRHDAPAGTSGTGVGSSRAILRVRLHEAAVAEVHPQRGLCEWFASKDGDAQLSIVLLLRS
jgi:hypothetical protein